ncbi:hypothetical protein [Roseobacter weihaiensis]|uniref:hypothetical protein n=1 Tax=Roseobacter weihaiensis TaxID=2763262 RepID=UPI001D0A0282|nr:hypothetical protein [Roseobacter sp. H9]
MENWRKALDGMVITKAAIVDNTTFAFVADWNETIPGNTPRARLISANLKTGNWGYKGYRGGSMHMARVAGGRNQNGNRHTLFVTAGGEVSSFEYKDGPNGLEEKMPQGGARAVKFFGQHFYAAGGGRGFFRRKGPGDWDVISHTPHTDRATDPGPFSAMDGYAEDDIYLWYRGPYDKNATDRRRGLEHWNGSEFTQIPLPKEVFENVPWAPFSAYDICCAPEGKVFLSGGKGELLMGGRDGFVVLLEQRERAWPVTNIQWFKGTLYGATDAALHVFDFDKRAWRPALFPGDEGAPTAFPYIDANEDVMLVAGGFGASIYDGETWTRIAGDVTPLDVTRLQLMERQAQDVKELRDILHDKVQEQNR